MPAGVSSGEATKYMGYMATSPYEGVIYKDMFLQICEPACLGLTPCSGWESGGGSDRSEVRKQWLLGRLRQRRQHGLPRRGFPPPRHRHPPPRRRSHHPCYRRCFRPAGRPPPLHMQPAPPHAPLARRRVQRARRCGFGSSWCSRQSWLWRSCCTVCMSPLMASSGAAADSCGLQQTTSAGS